MIRVYLKYPDDLEVVEAYIGGQLAGLPVIYLLADVCREELLVETSVRLCSPRMAAVPDT